MRSDQEIGLWKKYLKAHHGLDGELERLDGEFDLNIAVRVDGRLDAVLKVMRVGCDSGLVEMQVEALDHLAATMPDMPVPRVIRNLSLEHSVRCRPQRRRRLIPVGLRGLRPLGPVPRGPETDQCRVRPV